MTKHPRYQDYVIKDGKLVGQFEEMYRDHADPWEQTTNEKFATDKAMGLNAIAALKPETVLELGCGFGHYTNRIKALGVPRVIGVDIAPTAIKKAQELHPDCIFEAGDITDDLFRKLMFGAPISRAFHEGKEFKTEHALEIIVMPEITWYVLDRLPRFIEWLKAHPSVYLIHILTTYPPGEQRYGKEVFTDLPGIMKYFGMNYLEYGVVTKPTHGGCSRTYFVGRYGPIEKTEL